MIRFVDRADAAEQLLPKLERYANEDALVLALPRGGVPVGHRIARGLRAALDVLIVRKLGHPDDPELALGAIAAGGVCVLNREIIRRCQVSEADVAWIIERETRELQRREGAYRGERPQPHVRNRTFLIVDDGIATGSTMSVAAEAVRRLGPREIVLAAPVAPRSLMNQLARAADRVVIAHIADDFRAVGDFYHSFGPVAEDEVRRYLHDAWDSERRNSGVVPAFRSQERAADLELSVKRRSHDR